MERSGEQVVESRLDAAGELDATYSKIAKRIIPFLILLFVMAWLDRVVVSLDLCKSG